MKNVNLISTNIITNLAGGVWCSLINVAFIPFFIHLLGIEAYGLIGFYTSLPVLLAVFDFGLSSTINRELARLGAIIHTGNEAKNLVKTFEIITWGIGIFVGITIILLAPFITKHWLNSININSTNVETILRIMGLSLMLQWPATFYTGGLTGLHQQLLLNTIRIAMATLQYGGAILILLCFSTTIMAFFWWQLFIAGLNTLLLSIYLWKNLPNDRKGKAQFNKNLLKENWRFATGMTGISVQATILTQLDKIILSKMLSLEYFGYYTLAFSVANILNQLTAPISSVFFPVFSQIVSSGNIKTLSSLYHKACQLIALGVLPITATIAFFSKEILSIWLKNQTTVENTHLLLSLLVVGTAINTLVVVPYILQLAFGITRLVFIQNTFLIILIIPLMSWMINHYGPIGAAIVWIFINASYIVILIPIMHQQILKNDMWRWYSINLALPTLSVLVINSCARILMPLGQTIYQVFFWILASYLIGLISLAIILPEIRARVLVIISTKKLGNLNNRLLIK